MDIRQTTPSDLEAILALYQQARDFMAAQGNPTQWGKNHPAKEVIEEDIKAGKSYVALKEGVIVATFYFAREEDPTYGQIEGGNWLSATPYGVIHRIVGLGAKGAAAACIAWCFEQIPNLRIDTHRDNLPMQKLLDKNGFKYCGVIRLQNGSERLAYQKL